MKDTLSKNLNQFAWERIESQCHNTFSKSDKYTEVNEKAMYLIKLITKNAPESLKVLLTEYDEIIAEKTSIVETVIYNQGLNDGIRFAHTLSTIQEDEV